MADVEYLQLKFYSCVQVSGHIIFQSVKGCVECTLRTLTEWNETK